MMCFNSILFSSLQGGWERNEWRGRGGGESKGEQPPRSIWRKQTDVLVSIFSVPGALPTLSDFITTIILHCRLFYFHQRNWNSKSFGNIPRIAQLGSCRARIWRLVWLFTLPGWVLQKGTLARSVSMTLLPFSAVHWILYPTGEGW